MKRGMLGLWPCMAVFLIVSGCGHVQLSSFSMHFEKSKDLQDIRTLVGSSTVCKEDTVEGIKGCYRLDRASSDGSVYELIPIDSTKLSVGQAFDEAYRVQDKTGAQRVEPLFEIQMPRGFERGDLFTGCHDPEAENDDHWNLKQIRAPEAWDKIQKKFGVTKGQEAKGVLIAHIDTGYTKHPEVWQVIDGRPIIDVDKGYNYYDGDQNPIPIDPLSHSHLLDLPGHGTGSSSVIVSPEGCQLQGGGNKCPTGIGLGAQIAPLRVGTSVVQFNTRNIARAIRDVAEGAGKDKPHLVSIAMGGPPTHTLRMAVESAEKNGVLIIAASGNYVGIVVWPARFPSTIAVAATNVRCLPWKFSSLGPAVAISAPGESVWRAQWEKEVQINGMSKGTTFATGNTAGAAALWTVWHNAKLDELRKQGLITEAFRDALKNSAWKPNVKKNPDGTHCVNTQENTPWDTEKYGAGILDASALLDAKLLSDPHAVSRLREVRQELESLPLFATLYPPDRRNRKQIESDYKSLFGPPEKHKDVHLSNLARFETEIMYHYTMNEEVQQNIEALVKGQRDRAEDARRSLLTLDLSEKLRGYLK